MTDRGDLFRRWRAEVGLLLLHTSILLGVSPSQLSSFELGKKPWPKDVADRVDDLLSIPAREGGNPLKPRR